MEKVNNKNEKNKNSIKTDIKTKENSVEKKELKFFTKKVENTQKNQTKHVNENIKNNVKTDKKNVENDVKKAEKEIKNQTKNTKKVEKVEKKDTKKVENDAKKQIKNVNATQKIEVKTDKKNIQKVTENEQKKPQKDIKKEAKKVENDTKKAEKNVKTETKVEKTEKYTKIRIVEFVKNLKNDFKKYKNVEKLKVIDQFEDKLPKMKEDEDYFICENQNQNFVIKSGFMLNYGYKKMSKDFFVPVDKSAVLALKTSKNIIFSNSFGSITKLKAGDYIVIQNKNIIGMKKSEFEENYVLLNKANKILKTYEEELTK